MKSGNALARAMFALWLLAAMQAIPAHGHQDPERAGFVAVDGGRIWYRLNGEKHLGKRPAIIVIHGGPGGTHRGNMPYVALADEYPVILYDQLDTGNSDRPGKPENWRVERFVAEIDHLRAALGLREVIIAGHSWGGTLAAEYATRNPEGLKAVILSSPLINTAQWIADNAQWIEQMPEAARATIRTHEAAGTTDDPEYRAAEELFYDAHMCRKKPCPDVRYKEGGPEGNDRLYEAMWGPTEFFAPGTLKDYDVGTRLPKVKVPALMICGEFDEAVPASCRRYADTIRGSRVFIVPDAGHATMHENETLYLATVREFLASALAAQ